MYIISTSLLQVMGFGIFLVDSKDVNVNRLDSKKKLNFSKIDKILKVRMFARCLSTFF